MSRNSKLFLLFLLSSFCIRSVVSSDSFYYEYISLNVEYYHVKRIPLKPLLLHFKETYVIGSQTAQSVVRADFLFIDPEFAIQKPTLNDTILIPYRFDIPKAGTLSLRQLRVFSEEGNPVFKFDPESVISESDYKPPYSIHHDFLKDYRLLFQEQQPSPYSWFKIVGFFRKTPL